MSEPDAAAMAEIREGSRKWSIELSRLDLRLRRALLSGMPVPETLVASRSRAAYMSQQYDQLLAAISPSSRPDGA